MINYQQESFRASILRRLTFPGRLLISFRYHFSLLRWLIPGGLMLLVIAYEVGPALWLYERFGFTYHLVVEVLLFATVGPLLAFVLLDFLWRWLDERDTSDLQAQLLAQTREQVQTGHRLCDDALQALFAASTIIASLKPDSESSPELAAHVQTAEQQLSQTIKNLRHHLEG
jgi:signal transduction histidine kinase